MPYDPNLDECVFSKDWENEYERLSVKIYSYNKGAKKIQISRENKDQSGEYRFAKLGRLTKEEAEHVLPLLQEAIQQMD
ncbi:MAG: hypothetical protein GF333_00955 [Candidatus Omnitrophica bacterium]|nr:hypothetical protein [Candidatus Omnitrophota bacterium]